METNQPLDQGYEESLYLSTEALENLQTTARWALFLSILGFIGIGFIILAGIVLGLTFSATSGLGGVLPFPPALLSIIYIGLGIVYLFPILYLYRFATQMSRAVQQRAQDALNSSLANLKSHYKFIGILAVVVLSLYFVTLIGAVTMGGTMF